MKEETSKAFLLVGRMLFFVEEKPKECPFYLAVSVGLEKPVETIHILKDQFFRNILSNVHSSTSSLGPYLTCWSCCLHVCPLREKAKKDCNELFRKVFKRP